jgi:hypothetical protein
VYLQTFSHSLYVHIIFKNDSENEKQMGNISDDLYGYESQNSIESQTLKNIVEYFGKTSFVENEKLGARILMSHVSFPRFLERFQTRHKIYRFETDVEMVETMIHKLHGFF